MIKKYLNEETIQLKQVAGDYREAIRKAAMPLITAGKIKDGYIEQMFAAMEELGPYMVILPGVALVHARPSDNVKEECMSLMTLLEPVEFGHKKNDPVDTVFVLASPNKDEHLDVLVSVSKLLLEDEFMAALKQCSKVEEIIKYFKQEETQ